MLVYWADSIGRRNARSRGVAMGEKRRAADRAGRPAMRSPGRPPVGGRSIVSGSGRRSLAGCRARSGGGGGRVGGGRRPVVSGGWRDAVRHARRAVGAVPVVRRAGGDRDLCAPAALGCGRSRVGSAARRRRSPGSCVATPRLAAAGSSIAPRPRSGMPTCARGARSPPSSPSTPSCAAMCRTACPGRCSVLTASPSVARR